MSSPLDKLKTKQVPVATQPQVSPPTVPAVSSGSPLAKLAKPGPASTDLRKQFRLPISVNELEQMSSSVSSKISTTTDRITQKFTTSSFGELGDILYKVQTQASSLNADDLTKTGLIGWVRRKTTDVKAVLMKRFQSADAAFDELEGKMVNQRTVLEEWERDMETLYNENYQNYQDLCELLRKAEAAHAANAQALSNFPIIVAGDPEAFMKAQLLEEAKAEQTDISITCDTYRRQITICEHNAPDLRNRIRRSEMQRRSITRVINEVIPLVKLEFAKFLQSLETQKSIELVDSARDMGDQALRLSADSSHDAAIAAAKSANTPIVSTSTINHIRAKAISAITEVQRINDEGEQNRQTFIAEDKQSQAEYLKQLQDHKAV